MFPQRPAETIAHGPYEHKCGKWFTISVSLRPCGAHRARCQEARLISMGRRALRDGRDALAGRKVRGSRIRHG